MSETARKSFPNLNLQEQFELYSKYGESKSDGKTISLFQTDKWLKQAGIIDEKKVTTIDTGMFFNKYRLQRIRFHEFIKFVEELATKKKIDLDDMIQKLTQCGGPIVINTIVSLSLIQGRRKSILIKYDIQEEEIPLWAQSSNPTQRGFERFTQNQVQGMFREQQEEIKKDAKS